MLLLLWDICETSHALSVERMSLLQNPHIHTNIEKVRDKA